MNMRELPGRLWRRALATTVVLHVLIAGGIAVPQAAVDIAAITTGMCSVLILCAYGRELFLARYSSVVYEKAEFTPAMSRGRLTAALLLGALPAFYLIPCIRHHTAGTLIIAAMTTIPSLYRAIRR